MNWLPVTPDLVLPKHTHLLALRKRSKFPDKYRDETMPKWELLTPIIVARVGDLCGEEHPDRDNLTWYGSNYQSAYRNPHKSFSHYALLADLELPPIGEPTPEERAEHEKWVERSRRASLDFTRALGAQIDAHMAKHPELYKWGPK